MLSCCIYHQHRLQVLSAYEGVHRIGIGLEMRKQKTLIGEVHDGSAKWAVETIKAIDAVFLREQLKVVVASAKISGGRGMYWTLSGVRIDAAHCAISLPRSQCC